MHSIVDIDFIFSPQNERRSPCDCQYGMQSITTIYSGHERAQQILFIREDDILCAFSNVRRNEELSCSFGHLDENQIDFPINFTISYPNNVECVGSLRSSCDNINPLENGQCDYLRILEWVDMDENICNESALTVVSTIDVVNAKSKSEVQSHYREDDDAYLIQENEQSDKERIPGTGIQADPLILVGGMVVSIFVLLYLIIKRSRKIEYDDDDDL